MVNHNCITYCIWNFYLFMINTNDFDDLLPKIIVFVIAALRLSGPVSSIDIHLNQMKLGVIALDIIYNDIKTQNIKIHNKSNFDNDFNNFKNVKDLNMLQISKVQILMLFMMLMFQYQKSKITGLYGESGSSQNYFF